MRKKMTNNPGGIRWEDGSPAYNKQVKSMGVPYSHISPEEAEANRKLNKKLFSKEPEPYPYTHPIREIPDYSKVKKNG